ncbi:hypothetical protein BEL04_23475 [Mucilaginibacter sp. PPCGB 2223]|uniref:hypothetical protein n=1 Tax=Mucilaginibacter sp. PPCGB 2223 TaxID=1886027 RepID=UPI0008249895|nr:hypothetical protein [Mucilaginibacter sp. PPCGB 2223]OCX50273.1 hypothetical protein BEL04_23475 [Mucilaginibacter sp. PPCGB 2223]
MKKLYLIGLIAIILVAGGSYGYIRYEQANYPERLLADITGVTHYELRSTIYTEHDAYAEANISSADKVTLLKRLTFKNYPPNWKLKAICPFIPDNERGFLYYREYKKQKPHGYTLCFLQPKTNVVIVYEYREK